MRSGSSACDDARATDFCDFLDVDARSVTVDDVLSSPSGLQHSDCCSGVCDFEVPEALNVSSILDFDDAETWWTAEAPCVAFSGDEGTPGTGSAPIDHSSAVGDDAGVSVGDVKCLLQFVVQRPPAEIWSAVLSRVDRGLHDPFNALWHVAAGVTRRANSAPSAPTPRPLERRRKRARSSK